MLKDYHAILDVSTLRLHRALANDCVQIPHVVQHRVSGEKLPRLGLSVPYFELFMTGWEDLRDNEPHLKPWLDIGLRWAMKYYSRMDDTTAYVIAMCACWL